MGLQQQEWQQQQQQQDLNARHRAGQQCDLCTFIFQCCCCACCVAVSLLGAVGGSAYLCARAEVSDASILNESNFILDDMSVLSSKSVQPTSGGIARRLDP